MNSAFIHSRQRPGLMSRLRLCVLAGLLMIGLPAARAQPAGTKEYQIKAAFLYNFTQFVDWPTNSFASADSPLTIGVMGNDPFGDSLNDIVRGEKVNGHPLVVKHFQPGEELKDCHILFISQSESRRLNDIFTGLKGHCILTVGETEGFAQDGGIIRFLTEKNKIRLRINVDAAKAANLNMSSRLLKLAEIVGTQKE